MTEEEIRHGAEVMDKLIKEYGHLKVPTSEGGKWDNRPKSKIIKFMLGESGKKIQNLIDYLGMTKGVFNTKQYRGVFSFDELLTIAYVCGYTISFTPLDKDSEMSDYIIDPIDYFESQGNSEIPWSENLKELVNKQRREEYEKKKLELLQMKQKYGFED